MADCDNGDSLSTVSTNDNTTYQSHYNTLHYYRQYEYCNDIDSNTSIVFTTSVTSHCVIKSEYISVAQ